MVTIYESFNNYLMLFDFPKHFSYTKKVLGPNIFRKNKLSKITILLQDLFYFSVLKR